MKKLTYVVRAVLCVPGGFLAYLVVSKSLASLLGFAALRLGVIIASIALIVSIWCR